MFTTKKLEDKKNRILVSNFVPSPPNPSLQLQHAGGGSSYPTPLLSELRNYVYKTSKLFRFFLRAKKLSFHPRFAPLGKQ